VEEACSGVNSILFMTSACVFFAMWQRRGAFFLALLYALTIASHAHSQGAYYAGLLYAGFAFVFIMGMIRRGYDKLESRH